MATYDATVTLTIKVLISDNQPLPRGAWEWNQLSEMSEEEIEVELMDPSVRAIEQLAEAGHVEIDDITIARKEGYDIVSPYPVELTKSDRAYDRWALNRDYGLKDE